MLPEIQPEKSPPLPPLRPLEGRRALGVSLSALKMPTLPERIAWAKNVGFTGIELLATGEPWGLHAPGVRREERERLREALAPFAALAVQAPYKETFDVTLASPSAAIRRASVSEIWSVCRFVDALGGGVVLVRAGSPPPGVAEDQERQFVAECLTTLDRMAGSHNARIAITNHDLFARVDNFRLLDLLSLRHTGISLEIGGTTDLSAFLQQNVARIFHVRAPAAPGVDESIAAPLRTTEFRGMVCLTGGQPPRGKSQRAASPEQVLQARRVWEDALND